MAPSGVTRAGQVAGEATAGVAAHGRSTRLVAAVEAAIAHRVAGPPLRAGAIVLLAFVLERVLLRSATLPEAAYQGGFLPAAQVRALLESGAPGALALAAAGLLLVAAARSRSLGPDWRALEHGVRVRLLVVASAAVLAWVFTTYDHNFYLDATHAAERLILLALVPLIFWRPAFTLPFLAVLLGIGAQFFHPIGGFSWAPYHVPMRALFLFAAWWLLHTVTKRITVADLIFAICCMIAAHYWVSGWEKLRLDWHALDRVGYLLGSTWANGWLGFLSADTVGRIIRTLLALNLPMKATTLLVECGAFVALWRRTTLRWFLAGAILLHAAILAMTGIAFWWWIAVDALVLVLFLRRNGPVLPIFDSPHFVTSLILIGGGALWFQPVPLAWLDARATYTYRVEAVDAAGASHALTPAFFAPYDYQLTLGAFRYLVDAPRLPIAWGAARDRALVARLNEATTPEAVLELERTFGRNDYDPRRAQTFDAFMRGFVGGWQERAGGGRWPTPLQAPATLWTFPRTLPRSFSAPVERLVVYELLTFFDGESYVTIRRTPVRTIPMIAGYTPAIMRR